MEPNRQSPIHLKNAIYFYPHNNLCDVLPDSEFIGADKAYQGESQFATPFPGEDKDLDSEQRAHNYLLYAFRHTIEPYN